MHASGTFFPVPRYRLTIAYDGSLFHGWQKQQPPAQTPFSRSRHLLDPHPVAADSPSDEGERLTLRTVQEVVERAASQLYARRINVTGASRTDAGVHARFQTASFIVPDDAGGPPPDRLAVALNALLPEDVVVHAAQVVHDRFDPCFDCVAKGYRYSLHVSRERPLWDRPYVYHHWHHLNLALMNDAAALFTGTRDFGAFVALGHGRPSTMRTIIHCRAEQPAPDRFTIDVAADGFLWNMVRIIAGTIVDAGRGRMTPADIQRALDTGDRTLAGPTLPPHGLCLQWAYYLDDPPSAIPPGVTIPRELIERAEASRARRRAAPIAESPAPDSSDE